MVVRIRLDYSRAVRRTVAFNCQAALVVSSLMTPVALIAWLLGAWRLLADLKMAGPFAISQGLFSHWQVWIALGIAIQFASFLLHRLAKVEDYDHEPL